jgi:hypothetical protein
MLLLIDLEALLIDLEALLIGLEAFHDQEILPLESLDHPL